MRVAACLLSVAAASARLSDSAQINVPSSLNNQVPFGAVFAQPRGRMSSPATSTEKSPSRKINEITPVLAPSTEAYFSSFTGEDYDTLKVELDLMASSHSKEVRDSVYSSSFFFIF